MARRSASVAFGGAVCEMQWRVIEDSLCSFTYGGVVHTGRLVVRQQFDVRSGVAGLKDAKLVLVTPEIDMFAVEEGTVVIDGVRRAHAISTRGDTVVISGEIVEVDQC
jgi:hypothetical protein